MSPAKRASSNQRSENLHLSLTEAKDVAQLGMINLERPKAALVLTHEERERVTALAPGASAPRSRRSVRGSRSKVLGV